MERRHFLKLALGVAAGTVAIAASAQAAPMLPQPLTTGGVLPPGDADARPAVITGDELSQLKPEQVRWGHGHHWGWGHRHWGHRHWGWRHRHWRRWHRRHWRRRYW